MKASKTLFSLIPIYALAIVFTASIASASEITGTLSANSASSVSTVSGTLAGNVGGGSTGNSSSGGTTIVTRNDIASSFVGGGYSASGAGSAPAPGLPATSGYGSGAYLLASASSPYYDTLAMNSASSDQSDPSLQTALSDQDDQVGNGSSDETVLLPMTGAAVDSGFFNSNWLWALLAAFAVIFLISYLIYHNQMRRRERVDIYPRQ